MNNAAETSFDAAIVRTIRQPLLILSGDLRVRSANPAFFRTFRVAADQTFGEFVYRLGNGQWNIPRLRNLLEEILPADRVVEDYEVEHVFPDIGLKSMVVNARRLEQLGDTEELILLAIEDVTTQRDARREATRYATELERSNRDLEQFATIASHDLQEPLRTVTSFAGLLERRYGEALDDKAQVYLRHMTEAAARMQRLIRDLLAFSRARVVDEELAVVPLVEPLAEATLRLEALVDETGAQVTHDRLPTLRVQPRLIGQLFQNLVANAIQYRSDVPPHIHVTAAEIDGAWRVDVCDNGIGIDPAYHERIFGIFQRLNPASHHAGSGIGLAVCRRIVEHHGGTMAVRSAPGEGATFSFTLPGSSP